MTPLPSQVDVVVIGGGIAGVAVALYLAEGGAHPLLLEARPHLGDGASGRAPGLLFTGLIEHPHRLVHAMGEDGARAIYAFSRESLDLLADRVPVRRTGGWWAALDDREPALLRESCQALLRLGLEAELRSGAEADEALGTTGLGPALFLPGEGQVEPAAAFTSLARQAEEAGATLRTGVCVLDVHQDPDGPVVHTDHGTVSADAVVFAAGASLPGIDPFFEEKIIPVREQALRTAPTDIPLGAARAGHGYTWWAQDEAGRLQIAGARWATPHLEVGETDDTAVVAAIQAKLDGVRARLFPDLAAVPIERRWSWIRTLSCDGLPLVGPLPGQPQLVCCTGFVGNPFGLGLRAARAVCDGLLTGRAEGVPSFFTPARFV